MGEEQYKGIRLDSIAQHIRSTFSVRIYESHAKLALKQGNLGEFNQCQTQLISLHSDGIIGHFSEFHAYRILYGIFYAKKELTSEIQIAIQSTSNQHINAPEIRHALHVRNAFFDGDYVYFFRLYSSAPNLGSYFMDLVTKKVRLG